MQLIFCNSRKTQLAVLWLIAFFTLIGYRMKRESYVEQRAWFPFFKLPDNFQQWNLVASCSIIALTKSMSSLKIILGIQVKCCETEIFLYILAGGWKHFFATLACYLQGKNIYTIQSLIWNDIYIVKYNIYI